LGSGAGGLKIAVIEEGVEDAVVAANFWGSMSTA
jgi:hypothetical protein